MKILFTPFLSCLLYTSFAQTWSSNCTATPQTEAIYRNDVVKATIYRLFQSNSTYVDSIGIPDIYKDSISRALYAFQNIPASPLKDTILNLFGFSNFNQIGGLYSYESDSLHIHGIGSNITNFQGNFSPKGLDMYVADTTTWAAQWGSGNYTNTNNPAINVLALRYGITVTSFYTGTPFGFPFYHITARTSSALNTYPLAKAFSNLIANPQACSPLVYPGDGNRMQFQYMPDGIIITFSNRCGDCPAGCTVERSWRFKVTFADCSVEYLGATNFGGIFVPGGGIVNTCLRGVIVPIAFENISGTLQNGLAVINWKMLTQTSIKEYVVERSNDGTQFSFAGKITANSASVADYIWKYIQPVNGTAWYRVKAIDLDSRVKYSSVVKISSDKKGTISIYPNPVKNHTLMMQYGTNLSGKIYTNLYDMAGKNVWTNSLTLSSQASSCSFALPANLAKGMYALIVSANGKTYRQTIMVNND